MDFFKTIKEPLAKLNNFIYFANNKAMQIIGMDG